MDNCLVTGGAGFIGSHLVDALIDQGYKVVCVDDLSHGKEENINPKAKFHKLDIRSPELIQLIKQSNIRYVFHTAAQVDVQTSLREPVEDAGVNIIGTLNLLEACRSADVKKVIYSSSAAVYGEPQYLPIDEEHPVNPCSGYGVSKYSAELYLRLYQQQYGLDFTILRYANVYGPRQDATADGGVVAIFSDLLAKRQSPVIYGDGEQTRDFIYVGDVVNANLAAMQRAGGQVLNVSTGQATSINTLCALLLELTGQDCRPVNEAPKPGDIRHNYLSVNKAAHALDWQPRYSLQAGLRQAVKVD
ncbi:MAG: SDR family oxidoreductase [Firmicutes bacterium]|nr:SDR family oxidoreductase [Bacillota bacterium]